MHTKSYISLLLVMALSGSLCNAADLGDTGMQRPMKRIGDRVRPLLIAAVVGLIHSAQAAAINILEITGGRPCLCGVSLDSTLVCTGIVNDCCDQMFPEISSGFSYLQNCTFISPGEFFEWQEAGCPPL